MPGGPYWIRTSDLFRVREFRSVCHRRTESSGEPFTCENNLIGSRYVRGRLNTLAPISGSHSVWSAGSRSRRQDRRGLLVARCRSGLRSGGGKAAEPKFTRCPNRGGVAARLVANVWDAETAERTARQVPVRRQPHMPMSGGCIFAYLCAGLDVADSGAVNSALRSESGTGQFGSL